MLVVLLQIVVMGLCCVDPVWTHFLLFSVTPHLYSEGRLAILQDLLGPITVGVVVEAGHSSSGVHCVHPVVMNLWF